MRHFVETKRFGTAMVGATALGIGYQTGWPDWIALFSMPGFVMAIYWLLIDESR